MRLSCRAILLRAALGATTLARVSEALTVAGAGAAKEPLVVQAMVEPKLQAVDSRTITVPWGAAEPTSDPASPLVMQPTQAEAEFPSPTVQTARVVAEPAIPSVQRRPLKSPLVLSTFPSTQQTIRAQTAPAQTFQVIPRRVQMPESQHGWIKVPEGVTEGDSFQAYTPDGQLMSVKVPSGVEPGTVIGVTYPGRTAPSVPQPQFAPSQIARIASSSPLQQQSGPAGSVIDDIIDESTSKNYEEVEEEGGDEAESSWAPMPVQTKVPRFRRLPTEHIPRPDEAAQQAYEAAMRRGLSPAEAKKSARVAYEATEAMGDGDPIESFRPSQWRPFSASSADLVPMPTEPLMQPEEVEGIVVKTGPAQRSSQKKSLQHGTQVVPKQVWAPGIHKKSSAVGRSESQKKLIEQLLKEVEKMSHIWALIVEGDQAKEKPEKLLVLNETPPSPVDQI